MRARTRELGLGDGVRLWVDYCYCFDFGLILYDIIWFFFFFLNFLVGILIKSIHIYIKVGNIVLETVLI